MTVLRSGSATDVGRVRTVNEDLALESLTLFAVADGMGGHVGGEIAARTAIEALQAGFGRAPSADGLVGAVEQANYAVWERGRSDPALRGMGTTLIAAALVDTEAGDRLVLTNVGDSRAYRFHQGQLVQLTRDHSVAEELVARGELSEEEAAVHPHRHILTRALGIGPEVKVDRWEMVPEEGDRFLLCSDGVTNEVPIERIIEVLTGTRDPRAAAQSMVRMANQAGGNDNATVVVLDVVVGEPPAALGGPGDASRAGSGAPAAAAAAAAGADVVALPLSDGPGSGGGAASALAGGTTATALASPPPMAPARPEEAVGPGTAPPRPAPGAPLARPEPPADVPKRRRARRRAQYPSIHVPRRVTFRVVLFVLLLGGVAYAAYAVIHWYVDNSYYVTVDHQTIVIYQGRRGGFVGIEPKIVKRYDLTVSQVPSFDVGALQSGVEEPSFKAAENYVTSLQNEPCILQGAPATCSTTTTTTTTAPPGVPAGAPPPTNTPGGPQALVRPATGGVPVGRAA